MKISCISFQSVLGRKAAERLRRWRTHKPNHVEDDFTDFNVRVTGTQRRILQMLVRSMTRFHAESS